MSKNMQLYAQNMPNNSAQPEPECQCIFCIFCILQYAASWHMQNMSFNMQQYIKKYATICTIICQKKLTVNILHIFCHITAYISIFVYRCILFCIFCIFCICSVLWLHIFLHIPAYFLAYSGFILAYIFAYCTTAQAQAESKIQSDQVCATYQRAACCNLDRGSLLCAVTVVPWRSW